MNISPHENDFGAAIEGVDLSKALSAEKSRRFVAHGCDIGWCIFLISQ